MLGTVELLQEVLLNLPCDQVPAVKRVVKIWDDTTAGSVRLQVAIGQRAVSTEAIPEATEAAEERRLYDREAAVVVWTLSIPTDVKPGTLTANTAYDILTTCAQKTKEATLHPSLYPFFHKLSCPDPSYNSTVTLKKARNYAKRTPASWRKAFLTQPPLPQVIVSFELESKDLDTGFAYPDHSELYGTSDYSRFYHNVDLDEYYCALEDFMDDAMMIAETMDWSYEQCDMEDKVLVFEKDFILVNESGVKIGELLNCYAMIQELCKEFKAKWKLTVSIPLEQEVEEEPTGEEEDEGEDESENEDDEGGEK